jgi:ABC-type transport system substrate-binding protein
MGPLFSCDAPYSYWCDETLDEQLAELSSTPADQREAQLEQTDAYIYDNPPAVFLWELHEVYGFSEDVVWEPRVGSFIMYFDQASVNSG